ncbi:Zinc (Zn2)-Iron (Fe2) Permease [Phytophthora megakarya]|uniref:Zinc (Zn2)-Iron (Fe2) Permease n=1 Tax=Phytophthora megakarya TaxID=4795 RepID=A0A225VZT7_9STRA|nr:Zinc (Zn2)-Iron (Fe2) Permease [Phytophthora megakarya]
MHFNFFRVKFAKAKSNIAHQRSVAMPTFYSCMTPLGSFLSMVLSDSLALTMEAVALRIASGSFIYLVFHELSEENASRETNAFEKLGLFSIGISGMAVLAAWT